MAFCIIQWNLDGTISFFMLIIRSKIPFQRSVPSGVGVYVLKCGMHSFIALRPNQGLCFLLLFLISSVYEGKPSGTVFENHIHFAAPSRLQTTDATNEARGLLYTVTDSPGLSENHLRHLEGQLPLKGMRNGCPCSLAGFEDLSYCVDRHLGSPEGDS